MVEKIVKRVEFRPRLPVWCKYIGVYCRVSTKSQDQLHSLANQISYFIRLYSNRNDCRIRDVYIDIASGATSEGRAEYRRMLEDCCNHQLQVVITKSLSRLGRNTAETLQTIRELKALGIETIFEEENINTAKTSSELLISLISGIAQAENETRSANTRWGLKKSAEDGTSGLYRRRCYGYRQNEKGDLVIDEDEAETVRLIFESYLNGNSIGKIQEILSEKSTPSPTGKEKWCKRTIDIILSNEKYCGNIMLMKTINSGEIGSRRIRNTGQGPRYMALENHPPIIQQCDFDSVQEEKQRRNKDKTGLCDEREAKPYSASVLTNDD